MENTNLPVNSTDLFNKQVAENDTAKSDMASVSSSGFIATLAICYALSESFKKGIAQPGEFVLSGQTTLGKSVEVVMLQHRIHACTVRDKVEFIAHSFHMPDKGSIKDNVEYQKFITQKLESKVELVQGTDILFYIPSAGAFAVMYFKSTLSQYAADIYRQSAGGRLVGLGTVPMQNRKGNRNWYGITITPLNRAVKGSPVGVPEEVKDIILPGELLSKTYQLFINPTSGAGVEKDAEGSQGRDR